MEQTTLTAIHDRQVKREVSAAGKHGRYSPMMRRVVFSATTSARKSLISLGFTAREADSIVADAADMALLILDAD